MQYATKKLIQDSIPDITSRINALKNPTHQTAKALQQITAELLSLRSSIDYHTNNDIRKEIDITYNHSQSLAEAVFEGDVGLKEIAAYKQQVVARLDSVLTQVEATPVITQLASTEEVELAGDYLADAGSKISKYSKYKALLPKTNSKASPMLKILKLPLIGVFDPFITADDINAAGLDAEQLGMYPVIEDQMVLAINIKKLEQEDQKVADYLKLVLGQLSKKVGQKVVLVAEWGNRVGGVGYQYYWVMPDKLLTKLLKAHKSGHTAIDDWGFAF